MAKLEVKENVVFAEVKEGVSPYGEMMELLKEYIDRVDTITYCDELPTEGETDHLYIVRTGEAYIYEDGWIQLTGGGSDGITGISVNGTPQEVIDHVVDLLIPEKTSQLDNDSGYITEDALDGYALEDEIPTKTSQLENDSDYTTTEAVKSEIAEQIAEIVAGAPESLDTLKEIADWIEHHEDDAAAMNTAIKEAQETADSALTEAEAVKDSAITQVIVDGAYADKRTDPAGDRYVDLGAVVNHVKVGSVTTGDSPSVTNSGTDKDVTLDFVFPQSGVLTGTVEAGGTLKFTGECVLVIADDINGDGAYGVFIGVGFNKVSLSTSPGAPSLSGHYDGWTLTDSYGAGLYYTIIGATLVE